MATGDLFMIWFDSKGGEGWQVWNSLELGDKDYALRCRNEYRNEYPEVDFEIVEVIDG